MAEKTGREYLAKLDAAVKKCDEDQDLNAYFGLLETIFDGVKDNVMIEIPFDVDFKNYVGGPATIEYEDGSETLVVLTVIPDEAKLITIPIRLRFLIRELDKKDSYDGILFNPNEECLFIPKSVLKSALNAGRQLEIDKIEAEAAVMIRKTNKEIVTGRPISISDFAAIEKRIWSFDVNTDDFLKITLLNDEELGFLQILRCEGGRHLSLGYHMEEFGGEKPLVLGKALSTEKALEIMRRILVDNESTDSIKETLEFKNMGDY